MSQTPPVGGEAPPQAAAAGDSAAAPTAPEGSSTPVAASSAAPPKRSSSKKKVDENAPAFKKALSAAVLSELSKGWKQLSGDLKTVYEERAADEKAAVLKEAQSAARKVGGGEAGYAKLREQIDAFAAKQPEAFIQLHERLAADEVTFATRLEKQTLRDKQREAKEAEAIKKARYPIADHLLADEPPPDPPLATWPQPRHALNLPPELQSLTGGKRVSK